MNKNTPQVMQEVQLLPRETAETLIAMVLDELAQNHHGQVPEHPFDRAVLAQALRRQFCS